MLGEMIEKLKDMIMEHKKIVLPVVLAAALLITLGIGLAANRKNEKKEEVQANASGTAEEEPGQTGLTVPDVLLEENAYPEVNELITKYYRALEEKNTDALKEIISPLTEDHLMYLEEWSKYVQACPSINIYTKPGPREDSYLAYAVVDVQITGYDEAVPGLNTFFVCRNDAGNYYINKEEEIGKEEAAYIDAINMQDDVVDLSNKIEVEFKQMTAVGSEAANAYKNVKASITKGIQEVLLARQEAEQPQETVEEPEEVQPETVATEVKTTAVVNMRSSDSEKADKLGKAQIGDTFQVLEQRANGWTKLTDGTNEFFIKSDYLEVTAEAPAATQEAPAAAQEASAQEAPAAPQETPAANTLPGRDGKVTAKTTVNVRKTASETGEKLGKVYQGEQLKLIMNQADGWSKVEYKGQTAYVKSEFLE